MANQPRLWAIGIATRQRREMVCHLLSALLKLDRPSHIQLRFILVENEAELHLTDSVSDFQKQLRENDKVIHALESRMGIPFARNRILKLAHEHECELLAFLDDDVIPKTNWLMEMVNELQHQQLDLVGGPVHLSPIDTTTANWQHRLVWRGLHYRFRRIEWVAQLYHQQGRDDQVTVITSSWLANLRFLKDHQLQFDESMGLSGGTDSRFYRELKAAGGKTGWAPGAIVSETWPLSRLTLAYQYSRGRDQAIAHFYNKYPHTQLLTLLSSLAFIVSKLMTALLLVPFGCFGIGSAATGAMRSLGMGVGRFRALTGHKSSHYQTVSPKQP